MAKKWIKGAIGKPGALHRQLGIPEGQKIPMSRLRSAARSGDETLMQRANLAITLRGMNPWSITHDEDGWWVVKDDTGEKVHKEPHSSREEAVQHMDALYSAEGISRAEYEMRKARPKEMNEATKRVMERMKKPVMEDENAIPQ